MPEQTTKNFVHMSISLVQDIEQAKREKRLIVYIDEILFSKRSIRLWEWSNKNSNLTVNQPDLYVGFRSVIAAMTEENGIGLIKIHDTACTGEDFRDFLIQLRSKVRKRPVSLFMDNATIHKKPCVKEWYRSWTWSRSGISDTVLNSIQSRQCSPKLNDCSTVSGWTTSWTRLGSIQTKRLNRRSGRLRLNTAVHA